MRETRSVRAPPIFVHSADTPILLSKAAFVWATLVCRPSSIALFCTSTRYVTRMPPALFAQILAVLSLAIWLVLFFLWGNFWRIWASDADVTVPSSPQSRARITAVVPARNGAASSGAVVPALAKQDYPGEFSKGIADDE